MGGGSWNTDAYAETTRGASAFKYSDQVRQQRPSERKAHGELDPYGLTVRESRDSEEHPLSNPVMLCLDVTGSMGKVVYGLRDGLGDLMGTLLAGEYVSDPQLLFCAIGDAGRGDRVPFQITQFESDLRINDQLTKVFIEGGGGNNMESYQFYFYAAAYHTEIDCFEKRERKGYLFSIGDEAPYPEVNQNEILRIFGVQLQGNIPITRVVEQARKRYHLFHIIPEGGDNFSNSSIRRSWMGLLGEDHVFTLSDPALVSAIISTTIGMNEGKITLEEGLRRLDQKIDGHGKASVENTLKPFARVLGVA
ncbi:MAG: hypothetical protein HZA35_00890 [Parcubacteria group bacterium]|nr:hypothetical protein [Parcubacteria group bacterium]